MPKKKQKRHGHRPKKDMNPNNKANWMLVCSACGAEFVDTETIALAPDDSNETHWSKEHPELENPHFNLVWVGLGPAPKGRR